MIEKLSSLNSCFFKSYHTEKKSELVQNEFQPSSRSSMRRLKSEGQIFSIQTANLDDLIQDCENNPLGWPGLHWAIEKLKRPDVALAILERSPEQAYKALFSDYRIDIDREPDNYYYHLDSPLSLAVLNGYEEVVSALLKAGIDPNGHRIGKISIAIGGFPAHPSQRRHSISLLGLALQEKHDHIAKMLLAYGASPSAVDYEIETFFGNCYSAWDYAYKRYPDDRELVRLILEAGIKEKHLPQVLITEADIDLAMKYSMRRNYCGCPPLNGAFAVGDYEGAIRLIELGVTEDPRQLQFQNPWISEICMFAARQDARFLDLLLGLGYAPEQFRETIGLAIYLQNDTFLARLLDRGVKIDGLKDPAALGRSPKLLELALSRSFDLDLKAILLEASRQGCKPVVERILAMGIAERSWVEEAIKLARRNHQDEIVGYLKAILKQMN